LPEPLQKTGERLGGNIFERLRDGFGFIAHRDADAFGSVIQGEDSHCARSFAAKARRGEPISAGENEENDAAYRSRLLRPPST